MTQHEKVKIVVKMLKKRFPALTSLEATHVAYTVIEALDKVEAEEQLEKKNE